MNANSEWSIEFYFDDGAWDDGKLDANSEWSIEFYFNDGAWDDGTVTLVSLDFQVELQCPLRRCENDEFMDEEGMCHECHPRCMTCTGFGET